MRRERPDHTLQATALINEAYLRLAGEDIDWNSRAHFIGLAAHVMRQVLVDYARAHRAPRRAGGFQRVEMDEELPSLLIGSRKLSLLTERSLAWRLKALARPASSSCATSAACPLSRSQKCSRSLHAL